VLVLVVGLGVSVHIARVLNEVRGDFAAAFLDMRMQTSPDFRLLPYRLLLPPFTLAALLLLLLVCLTVPALRRRLRWRVPAFKDAALARTASVLSLMLRGGAAFDEAIDMTREMESKSPAANDLAEWKQRLAEGRTRFADIALANARFPKLFVWLVDSAGEDLAGGFARAAEIYHERASHRAEMALYGVLPVSILVLGLMIYFQAYAITGVLSDMARFMQNIGQG
jgi:type II secretory pathway component PulF